MALVYIAHACDLLIIMSRSYFLFFFLFFFFSSSVAALVDDTVVITCTRSSSSYPVIASLGINERRLSVVRGSYSWITVNLYGSGNNFVLNGGTYVIRVWGAIDVTPSSHRFNLYEPSVPQNAWEGELGGSGMLAGFTARIVVPAFTTRTFKITHDLDVGNGYLGQWVDYTASSLTAPGVEIDMTVEIQLIT